MDTLFPLDDTPMRRCNKCEQYFPETAEFLVTGKKSHNGLQPLCKKCRQASRRKTTPHALHSKYVPVQDGCKRCCRCRKELPATHEFFSARKRAHDGLYEYCKQCEQEKYQESIQATHEDRPAIFVCRGTCGKEYPFTEEFFYKNGKYPHGLFTVCKICHVERGTRHRKGHREAYNARAHNWRVKNQGHRIEWERQYRISHGERRRELERGRYKANPEPFLAKSHRYTHTERGRLVMRVHCRRRRARLKGLGGSYTPSQIQEQLKRQCYRCYYARCGFAKFPKVNGEYVYHIEHVIPVTRTEYNPRNDMSNIVLSCKACNQSKQNKLPHEWSDVGACSKPACALTIIKSRLSQ